MNKYQCYNCNYSNINKAKIIRHLSRKNICKSVRDNIDLNNCKKYILQGLSYSEYINIINNSSPNTFINNILYCHYCNKQYKYKNALNKHLNKCNSKNNQNNIQNSMKTIIESLEQKLIYKNNELENKNNIIEKQSLQINKLSIKNTNIIINSFTNTNLSNISDKIVRTGLKRAVYCIPEIIRLIHFNPDIPENHNIYISNIKNNYILLYDGTKWTTHDRDKIIDILIDKYEHFYQECIEQWNRNGKKYSESIRKFNLYLTKIQYDNILSKVKNEIQIILYNNRIIIPH
jgi:hypothetical protein